MALPRSAGHLASERRRRQPARGDSRRATAAPELDLDVELGQTSTSTSTLEPGRHVQITALTAQPRRRLNVFVDGELRLTLAQEVAQALGLHAGDPIDEELLQRAAAADLRWRAREAALSLLGYRARSAAELSRRLLRKEFPAPLVDEIVAELAGRGHVDDAEFARAFVRDRTRSRPRGRGHLARELRARGVPEEAAGAAIEAVFHQDGVSEAELARAAAEAWLRKGGSRSHGPEARRRLYAYLARRGFFGQPARQAIDAVLEERQRP